MSDTGSSRIKVDESGETKEGKAHVSRASGLPDHGSDSRSAGCDVLSDMGDGFPSPIDSPVHPEETADAVMESRAELLRKISAGEKRIEQLQSEFELERTALLDALRDRDVELRRVRNTLVWAVVTWIGKLKYGYVLPLIRKIRQRRVGATGLASAPPNTPDPATVSRTPTLGIWWANFSGRLLRRERDITLIPGSDLMAVPAQGNAEDAWESICGDPQFKLSGILPLGWVLVTARIEADTPAPEHVALFLDEGVGFSRRTRYELGPVNKTNKIYLNIGPEVERIRLDPIERKGRFRIAKFSLRPVTRLEAEILYKPRPVADLLERADDLQPPPLFELAKKLDAYDAWLEVNQWTDRRESVLRSRLDRLIKRPLLSVVMPVYDPPVDLLNRAIESIVAQVYGDWELCVADDHSTNPSVISALNEWAERDSRIKPAFRHQNGGISRATNDAAQMATGEFLIFVDNDDEVP
ncbi:MAG TPA: glycosyltransferase, partial [Blastocatellia bacterium]